MSLAPTADDLDVVRRINVFRGLNPLMIERLIAPAVTLTFQEHEIVFRQGDPAVAFFIVINGWVKLYRITMAGDEAVIHVFAKGDSFAEAVAFTGHPYPATAEAVSPSRIVRIPADHVVKCIRGMPEIALAMIASTSQHLHHLIQQVEQLKAQTGVQRVAEFLASLCPPGNRTCTIALPYDKALIAGRLGLKPESLSRAFAKLRSVGIDVHASHVEVRDPDRLRQLASDDRGLARNLLHRAR
ncbi:MAG: Crp/Fnr family transcriptional regulator [Hyphomicrobiales bacterium]|nr:Crp/Fnr family transcriptional regulator [Hyphomicrobiales bacterium]